MLSNYRTPTVSLALTGPEPVTYPGHFETRLVSANGGIRWYGDRVPVGRIFQGHNIGLEEIDHALFDVFH